MSIRDTWFDLKVELKQGSITRTDAKISGLNLKRSKKGPLYQAIEFSKELEELQRKLLNQKAELLQLKLERDRVLPSRS